MTVPNVAKRVALRKLFFAMKDNPLTSITDVKCEKVHCRTKGIGYVLTYTVAFGDFPITVSIHENDLQASVPALEAEVDRLAKLIP